MSGQVVVVDDLRTFDTSVVPNSALYLRTGDEALLFLTRLWLDQYNSQAEDLFELWLDHDLGPGDDIMPVVSFLSLTASCGKPLGVQRIRVHTMNPVAKATMAAVLSGKYSYDVVKLPPIRNPHER